MSTSTFRRDLTTLSRLADGATLDSTSTEVPAERASLTAAKSAVRVADEDMFSGSGLLAVCGPDLVDVVVTTTGADSPGRHALRAHDTEVRTA